MNDKNIVRLLAIMVFVASAAAAFSMSLLAYAYATGEPPFIQQSLLDLKKIESDRKIEASKEGKRVIGDGKTQIRLDEDYLNTFYKDMEKEREKIAAERANLEEQKKSAETIYAQAKDMQRKVEEKEQEVRSLLKAVGEKEMQNVADMQKLMAGMEPAKTYKMILELDQNLAARILYSMNKKLAAQIVGLGMDDTDKKNKDKIMEITAKMQTLSDELKGGTAK